ncbi:hypothetical protein BUALT_Bualt16G0084300 [Buddleja alternifolia]|uniref:J domain-containing protein n=1 Tax=Buddleja alternifolia TaxID=168488 RepID=A0AAV6WA38_9LAMI|nr:hypothetical protein BUALT_Bualt16G0084300 [Buddleja alternifolia]
MTLALYLDKNKSVGAHGAIKLYLKHGASFQTRGKQCFSYSFDNGRNLNLFPLRFDFTGNDVSGILSTTTGPFPGVEVLKKQYKIMTLALYPDKNKLVGAHGAIKLLSQAWSILSNKGVLGPYLGKEMLKKQYKRMALALYPDKNKSVGDDCAFKILSQAWSVLSNKGVLGLYPGKEVLKKQYERMALTLYPDKNNGVTFVPCYESLLNLLIRQASGAHFDALVDGIRRDLGVMEKQYMRMDFTLYPDKSKSVGADGAFKLLSQSWSILSNKGQWLRGKFLVKNMLKKQYKRMTLALYPDKNKSVGGDGAFKLLSQAWSPLSNKDKNYTYDLNLNIRASNLTGSFILYSL